MKKFTIIISSVMAWLPAVALAATDKKLNDIIGSIIGYLNKALVLLMAFAVVTFIYNVIRYWIMATDKRSEGAKYVMWSVIAFFVILSMWGIVNILISTFDLGQNTPAASWSNLSNLFPQ